MEIVKEKLSKGLDDVAKCLNLDSSKTIFLHSLIFDEDDKSRYSLMKGNMLYAEILMFGSGEDNGAKSVICYYNDELLNYYQKEKIINTDNVIKVVDNQALDYPNSSASIMFLEKLKNDDNLRKSLKGYTIVPSFISKYDIESAKLLEGKLLMTLEDNDKYTSKYWFREIAKRDGISVTPGMCFKGTNQLEDALIYMKQFMPCNVWIKLEAQRSGKGNIYLENLDVEEARRKIFKLVENIFDKEYIEKELPLIIERDASYGDEREVMNIGVEAVITSNKISIIGGVAQKTKDGSYLGSYIDPMVEKYLPYAEEAATKAFISYANEGYKGFITIDVIVTENSKTGEIKAYNIDPNARFSAGLMLLRPLRTSEAITGHTMYGLSFTYSIPTGGNIADKVMKCMGDNLYNCKTGIGLIPALLNDITLMDNGKYYLKVVSIANTYEDAEKMFEEFKQKIRELN